MGELIYASNMSLDGFTEDADGGFNWAPPDDEVFAAITEIMASAGTYLYGRRMYEVLAPWETDPALATGSELRAEYARVWQAPEKVVYSTTLDEVLTARTRVEREFDPEAVRAMKSTSDHDLLVGGPHLAAQAMDAGLIDVVHLVVWPIVLGGGRNPALAATQRVDLDLVDERRLANGVVLLSYRTR
jgi:dihydrofolate reductase